ncbi:MAG: superoxide dismutase [Verrucomicrobiota bacterium]
MNKISRRQALKTTALATAALAAAPTLFAQTNVVAPAPTSWFTLPKLPYAYDALEPHLDARTMEIHHSKHHATYVTNLNKAVSELSAVSGSLALESLLQNLDTLPEKIRATVRNHGGGHYNHSLFWQMLKPGGSEPTTELAAALEKNFGNVAGFKAKFGEASLKVFGSGWCWLTRDGSELKIETTANQDTPLSAGRTVLLGLDVWEHAYYLKFQNKRADYLAAWWNVVNWDFVAERFASGRPV